MWKVIEMSLSYIRDTYNVPAKRGMYIQVYKYVGLSPDGFGRVWEMIEAGRITSSKGGYIRANKRSYHPTDGVIYFSEEDKVLCDTRSN
jgi:hypothetical protein